jgi:hypothetical protein
LHAEGEQIRDLFCTFLDRTGMYACVCLCAVAYMYKQEECMHSGAVRLFDLIYTSISPLLFVMSNRP